MKIENVVRFAEFLNRFSAIKRNVTLSSTGERENDAEHSFQVALVSWQIAEGLKLSLDIGLLLKYALVHDLVEVYAGDTDPFISPKEYIASKDAREEESRLRIQNEFSSFTSLHKVIASYKTLSDDESKLVHLVDKMLSDINTVLSSDPYYTANRVTREAWRTWIDAKIQKAHIDNKDVSTFVETFLSYVEKSVTFSPTL